MVQAKLQGGFQLAQAEPDLSGLTEIVAISLAGADFLLHPAGSLGSRDQLGPFLGALLVI